MNQDSTQKHYPEPKPFDAKYEEVKPEEEVSKIYSYQCHACNSKFETGSLVNNCQKWQSDFIEQTGVKDVNSADKLSLGKLFKTVKDESAKSYNNVKNSVSSNESIKNLLKNTTKTSKGLFFKTIDQLSSVKDIIIWQKDHEVEGHKSKQYVTFQDLYTPLIRKFGLTDKKNANHPATDDAISRLAERQMTEDDKEENKETGELKFCECTIWTVECADKAIQLECGHYYHKDCLIPWLKIHNKCPTCGGLAAK
jgi:hypothetical protein